MPQKINNTTQQNNSVILSQVPIEQLTNIIRDCVRKEVSKQPTSNTEQDDLIQVAEAVKLLRVSKVTLYKWRKAGIIPFHRISKRIYFKKSELIEALKSSPRRRASI